MKKKVMLLIMFIPLVFMLTIYSVTKVVGVFVDVPVSGISITTQNTDGIISIDLSEYNDDLRISAEVLPATAKNRGYTYTLTGVNGSDAPDVSIDDSGTITANGVGKCKITVTSNESAFTDSVVLNVGSSKPVDITPSLENSAGSECILTESQSGEYDYTSTITSGMYNLSAILTPSNLSHYSAVWSSADNRIIAVNSVTGKLSAFLSGSTLVTAEISDGAKGKITKKILFTVEKSAPLTVNGMTNGGTVAYDNSADTITFFVETEGGVPQITGDNLSSYEAASLGGGRYLVTAAMAADHPNDCALTVSADGNANTVNIKFCDYYFNIYTSYHLEENDEMYHKNGAAVTYVADSLLSDEGISYVWNVADSSILTADEHEGKATVTARKEGETSITVTAVKNGSAVASVTKNVTVVKAISSIIFTDGAKTYGIGDVLALGDTGINGASYRTENPALGILYSTPSGNSAYTSELGAVTSFVTSDENTAVSSPTISAYKLKINSCGLVTVSAEWLYAEYFGETVGDSITVKTVKGGVTVDSYDELKKATDDAKAVVLSDNIMLGAEGASASVLQSYASYMPTTYDWTYYLNRDNARPEVMYLIEFKNDVYGNGYEINGDYITKAEDSTGVPLLFKGPLNFVSVSSAAVKAQDNIVFLARTAGITIDNVVLKGCSDESLYDDDGHYNLSELNYTGTTLEIAASVTLKNSRVKNGRTAVRVFGGACDGSGNPVVSSVNEVYAADERIDVLIESCILTHAREFILKIGSNRAIMMADGGDYFVPCLTNAAGVPYGIFDDNAKQDGYFYDHYVITDVTLKNSVLATSGLFSIGMETHFSGPMLDSREISLPYWVDLASTSYASVLHLEGDVKLLDWKKMSNVDSSTLIEMPDNAGENYAFLKMDIAAMLNKVSSNGGNYSTIITDVGGESYVHGGIAFYGGGNNYSYVDMSAMTSEHYNCYNINLNILKQGEDTNSVLYKQGEMLPFAAGYADFRFYIYGNNSATDYNYQQNAIQNGTAYQVPAAD